MVPPLCPPKTNSRNHAKTYPGPPKSYSFLYYGRPEYLNFQIGNPSPTLLISSPLVVQYPSSHTFCITSKHFNIKILLNKTQCNCDIFNFLLQKSWILNESVDVKIMLDNRYVKNIAHCDRVIPNNFFNININFQDTVVHFYQTQPLTSSTIEHHQKSHLIL